MSNRVIFTRTQEGGQMLNVVAVGSAVQIDVVSRYYGLQIRHSVLFGATDARALMQKLADHLKEIGDHDR